jgi:hypothetical protein
VPEGHAIGGIDDGHGIIAPAIETAGLRAATIEHYRLTLPEVARGITFKAPGITNRWEL